MALTEEMLEKDNSFLVLNLALPTQAGKKKNNTPSDKNNSLITTT
jgi:hypothetical protein